MKMTKSCFLRLCLLFFGCTYRGLDAAIKDACGGDDHHLEDPEEKKCHLYPSHELYCSWSFQSPENESQIITTIHVCEEDKTVETLEFKKPVALMSLQINNATTAVILHFNISAQEQLEFQYGLGSIEILPPPPNVQASFNGRNLTITWDKPQCRTGCAPHCLKYEVQIRDQETPKGVEGHRFYTEQNADPTQSYTVRIRTKIIQRYCTGSGLWSNWSQAVSLSPKQSERQTSDEVIKVIFVGIPLVILLLLLPVCHRVSKRLFPPIPSPPQKYLFVLENTDVFVSPDLMANPDEEITLVFENS